MSAAVLDKPNIYGKIIMMSNGAPHRRSRGLDLIFIVVRAGFSSDLRNW
ncbi:hypothetical protein [Bifidobacterium choerinum]|nr:hypothetical protein [Bifidobacterium choerinum]